jgi:hypothetical protein
MLYLNKFIDILNVISHRFRSEGKIKRELLVYVFELIREGNLKWDLKR